MSNGVLPGPVGTGSGGGGGGTEYTQNIAAPANPVGGALIVRRTDTPDAAAAADADGKNVAVRGNQYGALYAQILTAAGVEATFGGGQQYDEDTPSAAGEKLTMAGAVRVDTPAGSLASNDGDRTQFTVDGNGRLHVIEPSAAGVLTRLGEVQTSPTANTLLDRVKALLTGIVLAAGSNLIGFVGVKPTYAVKATITLTLTSLTNAAARESTVIDNGTNRYRDVRIRVQTKGQAGGSGFVHLYVYTALGDTTYTDGATGSDAAFTAANRRNGRPLGSIQMNADTAAVQAGFALSDVFPVMPSKWGLIAINASGAALSATGGDHVIEYEGIN